MEKPMMIKTLDILLLQNGGYQIYHYYHPAIKRSGIVYFDTHKIELLDRNKVEKIEEMKGDYSISLDIIRNWMYET